jgi:hypothetical protein
MWVAGVIHLLSDGDKDLRQRSRGLVLLFGRSCADPKADLLELAINFRQPVGSKKPAR